MSRWAWLGLSMLVVGAIASAPGLLLVGGMSLLTAALTTVWSRHGLRHVSYARRLHHDRAVWGDDVPLDIVVRNGKLLPLAWLRAEDFVSDGTVIRERRVWRSDRPGFSILENTWTMAPFERVVRHLHLVADHRGVYRFGPVRLEVADLFGRDSAKEEYAVHDTLLVRPRSVPVRFATREIAPMGSIRARHGLHEDPALFAGVRPFQFGDPRRRLHWRATARTGQPVS
ncbi:MAG TPA: DUF58 domain-containing protein, partial [Candidatus Saccharimonadales bacterium]|nr:DUF58 domain-containing protein [Candidatus Saccharimonadales bacterium]